MANGEQFEQIVRRFRRVTGQDIRKGVLGDANGVIYEPGRPGYVRVRFPAPDGYTKYTVVRMRGTVEMEPGAAVTVGYDEDEELAVVSIDFAGQVQQGRNPLIVNSAANTSALSGVLSQSQIATMMSHPTEPASTDVVVRAWVYIRNGVFHVFTGERVALDSYIPTTPGQHRIAALFLRPDDTVEVKASTAKATTIPLGLNDVQTCLTAASTNSAPVWCWRLVYGQTTIADADSWLDMRQFINIPGDTGAIDAALGAISVIDADGNFIQDANGLILAGE